MLSQPYFGFDHCFPYKATNKNLRRSDTISLITSVNREGWLPYMWWWIWDFQWYCRNDIRKWRKLHDGTDFSHCGFQTWIQCVCNPNYWPSIHNWEQKIFIFVKCYDTINKIGIELWHDQIRARGFNCHIPQHLWLFAFSDFQLPAIAENCFRIVQWNWEE